MTMYSNKLAVCIKTAGKVLREQGDKVFLPFGSEYSIFLKNLNSVRALVRVSLDGVSVTDGEDLVIYGNTELNLERYLKNGNMNEGNRFKFIERSSKIEKHRGIGGEDGLLRVEFQFEKVVPAPVYVPVVPYNPYPYKDYWDGYEKGKRDAGHWPYYNPYPYYWGSSGIGIGIAGGCVTQNLLSSSNNSVGGINNATFTATASVGDSGTGEVTSSSYSIPVSQNAMSVNYAASADSASVSVKSAKITRSAAPANDAGITVPGSVSDQKFQAAAWFQTETEKHVIVLKLLGETDGGTVVTKPVLSRQKQTCATCGTRNRGQNQFCRECGTALELVGSSKRGVVGVRG